MTPEQFERLLSKLMFALICIQVQIVAVVIAVCALAIVLSK
jgi:hypothetical protein